MSSRGRRELGIFFRFFFFLTLGVSSFDVSVCGTLRYIGTFVVRFDGREMGTARSSARWQTIAKGFRETREFAPATTSPRPPGGPVAWGFHPAGTRRRLSAVITGKRSPGRQRPRDGPRDRRDGGRGTFTRNEREKKTRVGRLTKSARSPLPLRRPVTCIRPEGKKYKKKKEEKRSPINLGGRRPNRERRVLRAVGSADTDVVASVKIMRFPLRPEKSVCT